MTYFSFAGLHPLYWNLPLKWYDLGRQSPLPTTCQAGIGMLVFFCFCFFNSFLKISPRSDWIGCFNMNTSLALLSCDGNICSKLSHHLWIEIFFSLKPDLGFRVVAMLYLFWKVCITDLLYYSKAYPDAQFPNGYFKGFWVPSWSRSSPD